MKEFLSLLLINVIYWLLFTEAKWVIRTFLNNKKKRKRKKFSRPFNFVPWNLPMKKALKALKAFDLELKSML